MKFLEYRLLKKKCEIISIPHNLCIKSYNRPVASNRGTSSKRLLVFTLLFQFNSSVYALEIEETQSDSGRTKVFSENKHLKLRVPCSKYSTDSPEVFPKGRFKKKEALEPVDVCSGHKREDHR